VHGERPNVSRLDSGTLPGLAARQAGRTDGFRTGDHVPKLREAIVLATSPGAETVVAGLPLAVRAVIAFREAGFDDVGLVVRGRPRWAAEPLARRGVSVRWADGLAVERSHDAGFRPAPVLLFAGDVLVDAAAAESLRNARPGPVRTACGQVVGEVCGDGDRPLSPDPEGPAKGTGSGTRIAAGLAVSLEAAGSAERLERALVDHLAARATSDSYLAALLDRPMSRPLTRLLLRTRLAPCHVTLLGMAVGLLGAMGLATVSYWGRLGGVLLLIVSLVLDCVDGDMARARLAQDPAGARLDVIGDYLVNLAVFGALAVGLLREGLPPGGAWMALALVTGVAAAMAVVHALFIRPALRLGGDLHWAGDDVSLRGKPGASVIEKLASRDYTYLLLGLAVVGHLEWFLYAAAVGAWAFTLGVVAYALSARPRRAREPVQG
jgi:phosphatidylglycerophosphate synthase